MKKTKIELTKKQWNDTIKRKNLIRKCNNCGIDREFKTLQGYNKSINTLCRSCNNSMNISKRVARVVNGKKECLDCKQQLPISQFYKYVKKGKNERYHSLCNSCKKERFKTYQKTVGRFKRHGITKEIYDAMYTAQLGKCYLCDVGEVELHIDHNHITGKVRSLLCKECNMALGLLKENIVTLKNMINYLEKEENEC